MQTTGLALRRAVPLAWLILLGVGNVQASETITFGVPGSTFTSTGKLLMSADGIQWPDNSVSTTACNASGCAGAVKSADNTTFAGNNTFNSSVTFNGLAQISGQLLIGAGAVSNTWVMISSANPDRAALVDFQGLSSSYSYRLEYVNYSTANYHLTVGFNSDTTTSYKRNNLTVNQGPSVDYSFSERSCFLDSAYSGYMVQANSAISGAFTIRARPSTPNTLLAYGDSVAELWFDSGGYTPRFAVSCTYAGSSSLSTIEIKCTTAGTGTAPNQNCSLIGHFELWRGPAWP